MESGERARFALEFPLVYISLFFPLFSRFVEFDFDSACRNSVDRCSNPHSRTSVCRLRMRVLAFSRRVSASLATLALFLPRATSRRRVSASEGDRLSRLRVT